MHLGIGDHQSPEETSVSSVVKVPESCKTHDLGSGNKTQVPKKTNK